MSRLMRLFETDLLLAKAKRSLPRGVHPYDVELEKIRDDAVLAIEPDHPTGGWGYLMWQGKWYHPNHGYSDDNNQLMADDDLIEHTTWTTEPGGGGVRLADRSLELLASRRLVQLYQRFK